MFNQPLDNRLSSWANLRSSLEEDHNPIDKVWDFWKDAPYIPYNKSVDPFYQRGWPTPWEIIVENHYDDFTKALMIGWTLKYSKRFQNSKIELRTMVDKHRKYQYNVVCVDSQWIINYNDNGPVTIENLPDSFLLENLIELEIPR